MTIGPGNGYQSGCFSGIVTNFADTHRFRFTYTHPTYGTVITYATSGDGQCIAGHAYTATVDYGSSGSTTNVCRASITVFHTESHAFGQHWTIHWIDASAQSPILIWEGVIQPGGSQTVNAEWDQGSGHCPGTLIGTGDRIGYDTATNIVDDSESGTRDLDDPGNGGSEGEGTEGQGGTNSLSQGDISALLEGLRGIAREKTQQGTTNLVGAAVSGIVGGNQRLDLANGRLATTTNSLEDIERAAGLATNVLNQIRDLSIQQLTNQIGISNSVRAPTSIDDMLSRGLPSGATNYAGNYEAALANDPWSGSFSNAAGPWAGTMGGGGAEFGTQWLTSSIPTGMTGVDPNPETDWFTWNQPAMTVCGVADIGAWDWAFTPDLPTTDNASFLAILAFMRLTWATGITFLLFCHIRSDIQDRLMQLASIPQAQSSGLKVAGWDLGPIGRIMASAALIAILYTCAAHLVGYVTNAFSGNGWNVYTWTGLADAAETGTVGGYLSIWIPRVLKWVGQSFPFALAFGAISMHVTYQITRDAALRTAIAALKRAGGLLAIPFLLFTFHADAGVLIDCGNAGTITIAAQGVTNRISVNTFTNDWQLQPQGAPGGTFTVPVAGLTAIQIGPTSNYLADLALFDGAVLSIVNNGTDCLLTRPDDILRENSLLQWGTGGLITGVFFGILSLYGWLFTRGLFPAGRNYWGGDA